MRKIGLKSKYEIAHEFAERCGVEIGFLRSKVQYLKQHEVVLGKLAHSGKGTSKVDWEILQAAGKNGDKTEVEKV